MKIYFYLWDYFYPAEIDKYFDFTCENFGKREPSSNGPLSETWQKIEQKILEDDQRAAMFATMKYLYFLYKRAEENYAGDEEFDQGYNALRMFYTLAPEPEEQL